MTDTIYAADSAKPLVVGIGGTTRALSSTDRALRISLQAAEVAGGRTFLFDGAFLSRLPHYAPENPERNDDQRQLVEMVRRSDGLIVASPGYHGGVSGLVKNGLDLLDDLRDDERCYLDGRAVGCIVTAAGWQSCVSTLAALRSIEPGDILLHPWFFLVVVTLNLVLQGREGRPATGDGRPASR